MHTEPVFEVRKLEHAEIGSKLEFEFEIPELEGLELDSPISGLLEVMRMEGSFNVVVKDLHVTKQFKCQKCLKDFEQDIEVAQADREFHFKPPQNPDDPADVYIVNLKRLTIDISELLRQEITLHFPAIPVCYTGCQGICPVCGKDRNKESCNCKQETEVPKTTKPLAALKDLLK